MKLSDYRVTQLADQEMQKLAVLLQAEKLPISDLAGAEWLSLAGVVENGELIAAGGIEKCGDEILLRSLVVSPSRRSQGLGRRVVENLHAKAHTQGYEKIYLLTLDSTRYFASTFAYKLLEREKVPGGIAASSQFRDTCPGSASLMVCAL